MSPAALEGAPSAGGAAPEAAARLLPDCAGLKELTVERNLDWSPRASLVAGSGALTGASPQQGSKPSA